MEGSEFEACVGAFMESVGPPASADAVLRQFELGFARVWRRAEASLGGLTLVAIAHRVLRDAAKRDPALGCLEVTSSGLTAEALEELRDVEPSRLRELLRSVLSDFLTVLGRLTAEILTPALLRELEAPGAEDGGSPDGERGTQQVVPSAASTAAKEGTES